jgi:hypothetical protein
MMFGHNVFAHLAQEAGTRTWKPAERITQQQFDEWQKAASFDIIKGLRYGQSFCNYFGITDNILYYEFSWLNADEYIRRAYIEKS